MSKSTKALTDDQLADLSWEMQKIVSQCNTIGEAMKLWVSSLAAFVDFHVSDKRAPSSCRRRGCRAR